MCIRDRTIQAQILELMQSLCKELGTALVIITHNLGVVARYAQRVNVMYAGKIIEKGTAKEIYANPSHPYTLGLLNSVPRLDEDRGTKLVPIEGLPPDLVDLPDRCSFAPRCRFVQDKCLEGIPPLESLKGSTGHLSACFRSGELGDIDEKAS